MSKCDRLNSLFLSRRASAQLTRESALKPSKRLWRASHQLDESFLGVGLGEEEVELRHFLHTLPLQQLSELAMVLEYHGISSRGERDISLPSIMEPKVVGSNGHFLQLRYDHL